MNYDEVMAIHNLKQKGLGELLEDSDIKDIGTLIECCNKLMNEVIDLSNENDELRKLLEEE